MEHSCHNCGAAVEDGVPFCPQCNAPQIRVDSGAPATPPLPPGTPEQLQPPAQPVPLTPGAPPAPERIEWSHGLPAVLGAGALLLLGWFVPYGSYCLWTMAGGALAVALYQRRHPGPLTPGMGARLGAVTGLLAFVGFAIAGSLFLLTQGSRIRELLIQVVQQAAARNPNPAAQDMVQKMTSPEGLAIMVTVAMIMVFAGFLVFSAAGGAIGAALFGRRRK
jgi:hypothetical protein